VLKLPRNKTYIAAADPVTLSWYASAAKLTAVPPIPAPGSYEVQYADNKDFTGATSASVDGATLEHQIAGGTLLPGRTYYWRVRAWSGAGGAGNHSAWSVMYSLNVKYAPPVLTVPANGATSVPIRPTFTWTAGGNGVWTSFTLLIGTNETLTSGRRAFVIPASMGTTYTIPPTAAALKANTQYYWRVYINGVYISTFSIDPAWGFRTQ
jgi:phosphodiesterase/alkaline phosphatase D-like protein